jgi:uncharacterized protein YjbJ (UPF0337 family)
MNKETVSGNLNSAKGKLKQKAGRATGSTRLEGKGMKDSGKGSLQKGIGKVKTAIKKGVDSVLNNKKH